MVWIVRLFLFVGYFAGVWWLFFSPRRWDRG